MDQTDAWAGGLNGPFSTVVASEVPGGGRVAAEGLTFSLDAVQAAFQIVFDTMGYRESDNTVIAGRFAEAAATLPHQPIYAANPRLQWEVETLLTQAAGVLCGLKHGDHLQTSEGGDVSKGD